MVRGCSRVTGGVSHVALTNSSPPRLHINSNFQSKSISRLHVCRYWLGGPSCLTWRCAGVLTCNTQLQSQLHTALQHGLGV